jgi:hypothetical protein
MVYKGSGLNNGRKGRVIPFMFLFDRKPRGLSEYSFPPGYIFKEMYINGKQKSHNKNFEDYPRFFTRFLRQLEEELPSLEQTDPDEFDDNYILNKAKYINNRIRDIMKDHGLLDLSDLLYLGLKDND